MTARQDRFDILKELAIAATRGDDVNQVWQVALRHTAALIGLSAVSVHLWDNAQQVSRKVSHAAQATATARLEQIEADLYDQLRRHRALESAYLSFGGDEPYQSFTLPLRHAGNVFGAVIGLMPGEGRLVSQDDFLETLSAVLALVHAATDSVGGASAEADDYRLEAIQETAVTVNHEVNSPLTAILGNVQLLLRDKDKLDAGLVTKLRTIEESAERIRDVTKRLLDVSEPRSIDYSDGIRMLDIWGQDEDKDPE